MEPLNQGQHIIGQVYLKQFAFIQNDKSVKICVWKKGDNFTSLKNINSFKKENNVFDLPTIAEIDPRTFEKLNGQIENSYPKILKDIDVNGKLDFQNESFLKEYVANMLCRTSLIRDTIRGFYQDSATKEKFLMEIAMFLDEPKTAALRHVDEIEPEDRQNYLTLFVMRHFSLILQKYSYCILKNYDSRGWITSDNPVILDHNDNYNWIIPIEAEIYFPLSKNYCLYMHHLNSLDKNNKLRNYPNGVISEITEEIQEAIFEKAHKNANEYVIFPWDLGRTKLSSDDH